MATNEDVDAFLEHHGVKGMHWGVRKAARKERDQSILDARARNASRVAEVNRNIHVVNLSTSEKGRDAAAKAIAKLQDDAVKSGDNALAAKSTHGEKVAGALLLGVAGTLILGSLGAHH